MPKSLSIPPNTIRAHVVDGANIVVDDHIRPCPPRRDWMDAVPAGYIYRCIPMLAANTMGWELLNPAETSLLWDGGERIENLQVKCAQRGLFTASSHFGSGIATWYVPFLFKTTPDLGLYICGPANHEQNGAQPLDAFVRTDWLPFPFTVNWKVNKAGDPVTFQKGQPIARIMPFPLTLIDKTSLDIVSLSSDPGFKAEVSEFGRARAANVIAARANIAKAAKDGTMPNQAGAFNSQYVKAKGSGEVGQVAHQTIFKPQKPTDNR